ncbi:helix-turn-helix transcriptional regulator [Prevotella sp. kh1p2]|uniref:helix-turn-helix transcriptional regulator n=1 Tax=Prevotella sp. kh1p2 TaxID=1761883 RepID=UPI0008D46FBB|nr:WYL domain-containing transcriptional regulator [Prevotella sp. kh1p2]SES83347.1 Predicted DNA-binding transcriptional regulator YafY, contains an HTH and WYL domains [Prevotella sp. kh1p2]SNU10815.1 Predicted DNA-binding transcriptional regulator YafY, contains an HTH and WYL domains [Prevotellaceae bacterium KH2P17]
MRHDKLDRELRLILLLTENTNYTAADLCSKLGISRRNLYYYLDFLRESDFRLIKSGYYYRLDRHSPFFRRLHESIDFTEDEAVLMRRMLGSADDANPVVRRMKRKLERFYDLRIVTDLKYQQQLSNNVTRLYEAIKNRRVAKLVNYSSPHSHTVSSRYVEPFSFMNGNSDIRCYEISSGLNKTFKVARMEDVEIVDLLWSFEDRHRQVFTDVFMFSGEQTYTIELLLGQLSCNLLKEEYPQAETYLTPNGDGRWRLRLQVCSFLGIGRFVLGLLGDIEVVGSEEFREYLKAQIREMKI